MHSIFRRSQAMRGRARRRPTWEERTQAALAAAREVEESSGESVPTRPSEVNSARRLCYGPRYILPGTQHGPGQSQPPQQREEPCVVLQSHMALDVSSLHIYSLVLEPSAADADAVTQPVFYTLSFVVHTLVPLTISLHWLASEEWGHADALAEPRPRFVSRVNLSRSYTMEPGCDQRFTVPRSDWMEPDKEPYCTLASTDWQACHALPADDGRYDGPMPGAFPQHPLGAAAPAAGDAGDAFEMCVLGQRAPRGFGGSDRIGEIQEVAADSRKAPTYGLVIELVDRRPGQPGVPADALPMRQISFIDFIREGAAHIAPRCTKQKLCVGGMLYQQHGVFGLSEALDSRTSSAKDDPSQCAICLSDDRDTVMLPCRHLCMCRECANTYRQQSNKCPICRTVVGTVLHIEASRGAEQ
ncbi:hypothetical protein LPJ61_002447 [Coemansia biformis]|uniref:RING-type domain-containing protein n=1 Tax=Coemansia biformis TaxID=1286918 RepID=A0A9W7YCH3_9FUNG|nr:hypothetical protein LPJ61_002447 [Coemansia biformis]